MSALLEKQFAAEGYMDLDNPSILNYNIASCSPRIEDSDENAGL
jgi:hypothetical protein